MLSINPFHASICFLYPMKTSENQRFELAFKKFEMGQSTNTLCPLKAAKGIIAI